MSYKKIITIMLVTVLLCASVSMIVGGRGADEETRNVVFRSTFGEKLSAFFSRLAAAFPSFSNIVDKITKAKPEVSTPEQEVPEEPQPPVPLVLDISMLNLVHEVNTEIVVKASLTNIGKRPLLIDELDIQAASLDLYLRTPEGWLIHYVGPYVEHFPREIVIQPEEVITQEIVINARDVSFGRIWESESAIEPELKPYIFGVGEYVIWGTYNSEVEQSEDPSSFESAILPWSGDLRSDDVAFVIVETK